MLSFFLALFSFVEKKRIKLHLMRTEYQMRLRTPLLDSEQLQNRLGILDLLHKYCMGETFPINTTHRQKIPQIMDKKGTMCAVAYVMYNSGRQNLISHLVQNHNHIMIGEVPDDHDLIRSLKHNGITKKEAGRIQPTYNYHCLPIFDHIQLVEPTVAFIGVILSIAGLAISVSFYRVLRIMYADKRITMVAVVLAGFLLTGGGFEMVRQSLNWCYSF